MNFKTVQDTKSKHSNDGSLCSTYSQIIEATGEAYGLTKSRYALGKCTGISIIDSTPLVSCHIKRMHMHKTMKGWAAKGKCTMGWFYGSDLLLRR